MDPKKRLQESLNKQIAILDLAKKEGRGFTDAEKTDFDAQQKVIDECKALIAAEEALAASKALLNAPDPSNPPAAARVDVKVEHGADTPFKNLAEQLKAIENHARTAVMDERQLKVQNASGATAGSGADGGLAIQRDFGAAMMESAVKDDPLLSLLDSYPISANADRVAFSRLKEPSIATTVFGGLLAYWAAEAASVTATKPTMEEVEVKLQKLMVLYYNTVELESDSTFNSAIVQRGATAAIRRTLAAAIYNGDGVGKPRGILQAPGLVSVAKEGGQTMDTVVWENISKMYNRALGNKSDFVWLCHPDVIAQLENMVKIVGTGGVPVYLPSALAGSVDTLRGRPIYESDQCQALGDKGDIMFVNPKDYLLVYKGGIDTQASIHVAFTTAENCFRFMFRCNGIPKSPSALTIKNSSATRSTAVTLDARA